MDSAIDLLISLNPLYLNLRYVSRKPGKHPHRWSVGQIFSCSEIHIFSKCVFGDPPTFPLPILEDKSANFPITPRVHPPPWPLAFYRNHHLVRPSQPGPRAASMSPKRLESCCRDVGMVLMERKRKVREGRCCGGSRSNGELYVYKYIYIYKSICIYIYICIVWTNR